LAMLADLSYAMNAIGSAPNSDTPIRYRQPIGRPLQSQTGETPTNQLVMEIN